jgi:hypothetical protein
LIGRSRFRGFASAYRWLALLYPAHAIVLGLTLGWGEWEARELVFVGAGIALSCVAVRRASSLRRQLAVAVVLFAVGCSALQVRRDETRERAFGTSFALHLSSNYWAPMTHIIDRKPRRIAITGGPKQNSDHWFGYVLLGPRLANRVVYVPPTRDGGIADNGPHGDLERRADAASWHARLLAGKIGAVMTFGPRSLEQQWMDAAPDLYRRVAGEAETGLYRVLR